MTTPTTPFTFSYIVVDQRINDEHGQPILGVYTFWTNDGHDLPIKVFQSLTPPIVAKIYAGTPYPNFDFTAAIERRIRLDIQRKYEYGAAVAGQINDKDWHLDTMPSTSKLEL